MTIIGMLHKLDRMMLLSGALDVRERDTEFSDVHKTAVVQVKKCSNIFKDVALD